ncbi:hypothetical protein Tco_0350070, partial [Tanacetum coccineum]
LADFVPGRAVSDVAHHKRVKCEAKCVDIGYDFLPFSFSSFGELEKDAVVLLKRIRKFSLAQAIRARAAIHIFNRIRELEADAVKQVRKFSMAQDIGARDTVHIFNSISFAIPKGVGA